MNNSTIDAKTIRKIIVVVSAMIALGYYLTIGSIVSKLRTNLI